MKFSLTFISALFFGASAVVAAPSPRSCSMKDAKVPFPIGQTALVVPTGSPSFIGLGVGVQNYTCNATSGTYVSAGAVAELFDLSCLYKMPNSDNIPAMALKAWEAAPSSMTIQKVIAGMSKINYFPISSNVLGQHYFIRPTPGGAISPKWDFTSSGTTKGNVNAFVVGAKDAQLAAPNPATDVAWLQLHGTSGNLATSIYRVLTAGGQPPSSCVAGSADISVKYASDYYFYGSTL